MNNKEVILSEGIYIVTEKIASSEDEATFKVEVKWYDDDKNKTFDIHYMCLNIAFDSNNKLITTQEEILELKKYFFSRAVFHGYILKTTEPKEKLCGIIIKAIEKKLQNNKGEVL